MTASHLFQTLIIIRQLSKKLLMHFLILFIVYWAQ